MVDRDRARLLVAVVVVAASLQGGAAAHLHHGHAIAGTAVLSPGPSGWATFSIAAVADGPVARGVVTIDRNVLEIECIEVADMEGSDPPRHFVIAGWRMGTERYQLWIDAEPTDPTPWFEIFIVLTDGSACDGRSLGGLAGGRGQFVVAG